VFIDHIDPMLLLHLVTYLPACINLTTYYPFASFLDTLGCGISVWVDLLSHAIMSHHTSLSSFVMLIWFVVYCESCGLPFVVMWVDRGSGSMLWFEQGLK
jgi:hypothetical protein